MDHYRCVTIYFPKTRKTAVLGTVTFIPHSVKFPKVTLEEFLKQATEDIITILKSPKLLPSTIPQLSMRDDTTNALTTIAEALHQVAKLPTSRRQNHLIKRTTSPLLVGYPCRWLVLSAYMLIQ